MVWVAVACTRRACLGPVGLVTWGERERERNVLDHPEQTTTHKAKPLTPELVLTPWLSPLSCRLRPWTSRVVSQASSARQDWFSELTRALFRLPASTGVAARGMKSALANLAANIQDPEYQQVSRSTRARERSCTNGAASGSDEGRSWSRGEKLTLAHVTRPLAGVRGRDGLFLHPLHALPAAEGQQADHVSTPASLIARPSPALAHEPNPTSAGQKLTMSRPAPFVALPDLLQLDPCSALQLVVED